MRKPICIVAMFVRGQNDSNRLQRYGCRDFSSRASHRYKGLQEISIATRPQVVPMVKIDKLSTSYVIKSPNIIEARSSRGENDSNRPKTYDGTDFDSRDCNRYKGLQEISIATRPKVVPMVRINKLCFKKAFFHSNKVL